MLKTQTFCPHLHLNIHKAELLQRAGNAHRIISEMDISSVGVMNASASVGVSMSVLSTNAHK